MIEDATKLNVSKEYTELLMKKIQDTSKDLGSLIEEATYINIFRLYGINPSLLKEKAEIELANFLLKAATKSSIDTNFMIKLAQTLENIARDIDYHAQFKDGIQRKLKMLQDILNNIGKFDLIIGNE